MSNQTSKGKKGGLARKSSYQKNSGYSTSSKGNKVRSKLFKYDQKMTVHSNCFEAVVNGCALNRTKLELERLFTHDPMLMLQKMAIEDPAGRKFKSISMYQYAVWALDSDLQLMMESCLLTNDEALVREMRLQFKELKDHEITYSMMDLNGNNITFSSSHFDLDPLINALQDYDVNYSKLSADEKKDLWLKTIAKKQAILPVHIAMQISQASESYNFLTGVTSPKRAIPTITRKTEIYPGDNFESEILVPWFDRHITQFCLEYYPYQRAYPNEGMGKSYGVLNYEGEALECSSVCQSQAGALLGNRLQVETMKSSHEAIFRQTDDRLLMLHSSYTKKIAHCISKVFG